VAVPGCALYCCILAMMYQDVFQEYVLLDVVIFQYALVGGHHRNSDSCTAINATQQNADTPWISRRFRSLLSTGLASSQYFSSCSDSDSWDLQYSPVQDE
jgi:hypothetical protein